MKLRMPSISVARAMLVSAVAAIILTLGSGQAWAQG